MLLKFKNFFSLWKNKKTEKSAKNQLDNIFKPFDDQFISQTEKIQSYLTKLVETKNFEQLLKALDNGASLNKNLFMRVFKDFKTFLQKGGNIPELFQIFNIPPESMTNEYFTGIYQGQLQALLKITFHHKHVNIIKSPSLLDMLTTESPINLSNSVFSFFIRQNGEIKPLLKINSNPVAFELMINLLFVEKDNEIKKLKQYIPAELFFNLHDYSKTFSDIDSLQDFIKYIDQKLTHFGYDNLSFDDNEKKSIQTNSLKHTDIIQILFKNIDFQLTDYRTCSFFVEHFFAKFSDAQNIYRYGTVSFFKENAVSSCSTSFKTDIQENILKFHSLENIFKNDYQNNGIFHKNMLNEIKTYNENLIKQSLTIGTYTNQINLFDLPENFKIYFDSNFKLLKNIQNITKDPEIINYSETTFQEIIQIAEKMETISKLNHNMEDFIFSLETIFTTSSKILEDENNKMIKELSIENKKRSNLLKKST